MLEELIDQITLEKSETKAECYIKLKEFMEDYIRLRKSGLELGNKADFTLEYEGGNVKVQFNIEESGKDLTASKVGCSFEDVIHYAMTKDGSIDLAKMRELEGRYGYNGGKGCDVLEGPCSCGSWHHKGELSKKPTPAEASVEALFDSAMKKEGLKPT